MSENKQDDDSIPSDILSVRSAEDELELLRTIEMDSFSSSDTRPLKPLMDTTTARHDVPGQLLQRARRTIERDALDEPVEFEAVMDAEGKIEVPEKYRSMLDHAEFVVRILIDE